MIKVNGTIIKNFLHCKRQAYLYYQGINFRNELINKGEILHEIQKSKEFVFEKIKVDDIIEDGLIEYKKTSSNLEGTKFQTLYYLKYFKDKGIIFKGLIKDLTYKKEYNIELTKNNEEKLLKIINEIKYLIKNKNIPNKLKSKSLCKGCSFYNYCWIE